MIKQDYIIKKALNESINDFLIEEGFWDSVKNGARWLGNKAWNGIKAYMDNSTNGAWNREFGKYVNGNGRGTEIFYLNKWFRYHLRQIERIDANLKDPSYGAHKTRKVTRDKYGNETYDETVDYYDNIKSYIQKYVNADNFNYYVSQYIQNRGALKCIDEYIDTNAKMINDLKTAENILNISTFMKSPQGNTLMSGNLNNQRTQYKNEKMDNQRKAEEAERVAKSKAHTEAVNKQVQELMYIYKWIPTVKSYIKSYGYEWNIKLPYLANNFSESSPNFSYWLNSYVTRDANVRTGEEAATNLTFEKFKEDMGKKYYPEALSMVEQQTAAQPNNSTNSYGYNVTYTDS